MPSKVEIVEVGPRDGLQSEPVLVSTSDKVDLIRELIGCGLRRIEVTSFVHPERVPQMADAERVMASMKAMPGTSLIGLVVNERGVQRAIDAGVDEVNFVIPVTDEF